MPDKKLIVFDFDGTLVDSQPHFNEALAEFSTMKSLSYDFYKMQTGYIDPLKYDLGWGVALESQPEIFKEFGIYMDEQVINHNRLMPELYQHVREVLEDLRSEFDLSIVTARSRSTMLATLVYHQLDGLFPAYRTHCCTKERNYQLKPSADALHCLLKDTKHPVTEIVVIGDTTSDILTANEAGAKSIGVLWGAHPAEKLQTAKPTILIDRVQDMPDAVRNIFKS